MNASLAIWSYYFHEMSPEDAVLEFIDNGIYASELSDEHGAELFSRSDNYIETGKKFGEFLREHNFCMLQGHLWLKAKICSDEGAVETLCKWIDMYEAIGIKNMVLHCDEFRGEYIPKNEKRARNLERLKLIAEHVKDKNVTICLENLTAVRLEISEDILTSRTADDLLYYIEQLGSDRFGICLDTGHLNLTDKDQTKFILRANKRLKALHIADNEGVKDQHMMPYAKGNINFVEVVKALREVGYDGLFNLEIGGETKIPLELRREKLKYIKACYDYLMTR